MVYSVLLNVVPLQSKLLHAVFPLLVMVSMCNNSFLLNRCYHKSLDFQRSQVTSTDFQRIKVQEEEDFVSSGNSGGDSNSSRLPRSVEVEVRGDLVRRCKVADIITVSDGTYL